MINPNTNNMLTGESKTSCKKHGYEQAFQNKQKLYHQVLLHCAEELDKVFDYDPNDDVNLEDLHGHILREIKRIETCLCIPRSDRKLDSWIIEVAAHDIDEMNETIKRINADRAYKDVQAPLEIWESLVAQIQSKEVKISEKINIIM